MTPGKMVKTSISSHPRRSHPHRPDRMGGISGQVDQAVGNVDRDEHPGVGVDHEPQRDERTAVEHQEVARRIGLRPPPPFRAPDRPRPRPGTRSARGPRGRPGPRAAARTGGTSRSSSAASMPVTPSKLTMNRPRCGADRSTRSWRSPAREPREPGATRSSRLVVSETMTSPRKPWGFTMRPTSSRLCAGGIDRCGGVRAGLGSSSPGPVTWCRDRGRRDGRWVRAARTELSRRRCRRWS